MLISEYKSRTEKEKVIASVEKGRGGPEKDAHLKTRRKKSFFFVFFFVGPPSHRGLTWFYKDTSLPLWTPWFVDRP